MGLVYEYLKKAKRNKIGGGKRQREEQELEDFDQLLNNLKQIKIADEKIPQEDKKFDFSDMIKSLNEISTKMNNIMNKQKEKSEHKYLTRSKDKKQVQEEMKKIQQDFEKTTKKKTQRKSRKNTKKRDENTIDYLLNNLKL